MGFAGQLGVNHLGLGRVLQSLVDVPQATDALVLGDVEIALVPNHTVGHVQALGDDRLAVGAAVTIRVLQGVDHVFTSRTDVDHAAVATCERTRIRHVVGVQRDREPGRQLNLVQSAFNTRSQRR